MKPTKILVVEDEKIVAKDIQHHLLALGYDVPATASHPEEAREMVEKHRPQLVLMDIQLKDRADGISLAEEIRKNYQIPVVYLTAYADSETLNRAKITSPFGYLLKPFNEKELHTTIEMALYKYNMEWELKQREQWLSTTLNSIGDAVVATDEKGAVQFLNPKAAKLIDLREEEVLGKMVDQIFPTCSGQDEETSPHPVIEVLGKTKSPSPHEVDLELVISEKKVTISHSVAPLTDDQGKITGAVWVFRDITQKKKDENRLRRHYQQTQTLREVAESFNQTSNLDEVYQIAVKGIGELMGGRGAAILIRQEDGSFAHQSWSNLSDTFRKQTLEWEMWTQSEGTTEAFSCVHCSEEAEKEWTEAMRDEGFLSMAAFPIQLEGEALGWITNWHDRHHSFSDEEIHLGQVLSDNLATTIRRLQSQEALTAEKERLDVTLESIGDGVISTDIKGRVLLLNREAERLTGYSQTEVRGRRLDSFFQWREQDSEEGMENPLHMVLKGRTGGRSPIEGLVVHRQGDKFAVALSGAPILDEDDQIIGAVLVLRDITKSQALEKELEKLIKLESIGILAGGIAHDFNNILTAIVGNLALAKRRVESPDSKKVIEEAENAVFRAKDLTLQLLTFSKGGNPIKKLASLQELLQESVAFALRGSNVACEFDLPDDLWNIEVDEGLMNQVLHNLIINADQAMPEGGIIHIGAENLSPRDLDPSLPLQFTPHVKIKISDEGKGISPENISQIFDPYFTTKPQGSGLGLTTSFSIVARHKGHLTVESTEGERTTFNIYLPATREEIKPPDQISSSSFTGKGHILLVDDEAMVRDSAGEILMELGYQVDYAWEGKEALEKYRRRLDSETPYMAVLMDLTIPGGMGGKVAIEEFLKLDPQAQVVVCSGYSRDPILVEYKKHGFCQALAKPFKLEDLVETIESIRRPS